MPEKLLRSHSLEKSKGAGGITTSGSFSFWEDSPVSPLNIGDEFQPVPGGPTLKVDKISISDSVVGERFAAASARVTHNHPEGIKGAQATAGAILLARQGKSKAQIREYVESRYGYDLSRTLDEIRPGYRHVESCQETAPAASFVILPHAT